MNIIIELYYHDDIDTIFNQNIKIFYLPTTKLMYDTRMTRIKTQIHSNKGDFGRQLG